MKEVKSPKKPLLYYYGIVLLVLVIFNVIVTPMITKSMVREVDYGTFMSKIEDKKIEDVQIEDNQILFTDKDDSSIVYKIRCDGRPDSDRASLRCRSEVFQGDRSADITAGKFSAHRYSSAGDLYRTWPVYGPQNDEPGGRQEF